jgi:hypothetical protein
LHGDYDAIAGQQRRDRLHRLGGVLSLDRQQHQAERAAQLFRPNGRRVYRELLSPAADSETTIIYRYDMCRDSIAECDRVSSPRQVRANRPADRPRADNSHLHRRSWSDDRPPTTDHRLS